MSKRMLIDAVREDEQRVAVLDGTSMIEADFNSASKTQIKGNIYLARITRVEPSLQAAFVDFGHGKHGFLPFTEIHPDYFQIPVADREALVESVQEAVASRQAQAQQASKAEHKTEQSSDKDGAPQADEDQADEDQADKTNAPTDTAPTHTLDDEKATPEEEPKKKPRGRPRKKVVTAAIDEEIVIADEGENPHRPQKYKQDHR